VRASGLHLTPDMLEAAYEYLRVSPPFRRWKMPAGDDVGFHVTRDKQVMGKCIKFGNEYTMKISAHAVSRTLGLMELMAHEMVHLHLFISRAKDPTGHGREFKRCAAQVCRHHGFDPKLF
jgi:hypothetical protein